MKLRRSIAWTYGNDYVRTRQQIESQCDCITIDLEDAVVPSSKYEARMGAVEMLKTWNFYNKERIVRINGPNTQYYELDLKYVILPGLPDAIRLPKCETTDYVLKVSNDLEEIERQAGLPNGTIEILAMIESPRGIRKAYDIASCTNRVTALSLGMEDLTTDMGISRHYEINTNHLVYARQKFVLDAKAAGVQAIDSGLNKICTLEYNTSYSIESRQMGFDGRSVRDGKEAIIANKAYSPKDDEIDWAKRAIKGYEEANINGDSKAYVDGKHLCTAAYMKAKRIMEQVALIKETF